MILTQLQVSPVGCRNAEVTLISTWNLPLMICPENKLCNDSKIALPIQNIMRESVYGLDSGCTASSPTGGIHSGSPSHRNHQCNAYYKDDHRATLCHTSAGNSVQGSPNISLKICVRCFVCKKRAHSMNIWLRMILNTC